MMQTPDEAGRLIEDEMRKNISSGLGTKLTLDGIDKIEPYSGASALCWLTWTFHPHSGSEFHGKTWTFTNVYGYRAADERYPEGWEFVVRDQEVNEMMKAIGLTFEV